MPTITLKPEHPATRLMACTVTGDAAGLVQVHATAAGRSVMVVHADAPLTLGAQVGVAATLRPGWDGSLGYSLYALELAVAGAGAASVQLIAAPVPPAPLVTTPAEHAAWLAAFQVRPSRFPAPPAAFAEWQETMRGRLAGWMMNGGPPARVPLAAEVLEVTQHPAFELRRVRYHAHADRTTTLLLALPRQAEPAPLLVALHGHEATWGEADAGAFTAGHSDDFCAYFAARGWAVMQPATMNHTRHDPTWTLQGEWAWDARVALDYALTLPAIDDQRVAVCGLSTGAHLAMNLLALDARVRAGVVGCIFGTWHHVQQRLRIPPHCDCGITAQLCDRLEQCDWAALAAPKPVQFQHGRQDATFCPGAEPNLQLLAWNAGVLPPDEFATAFAEVQRAYAIAGAALPPAFHLHDDGHRVDAPAACAFLTAALPAASGL